jgi:hypothetical protein
LREENVNVPGLSLQHAERRLLALLCAALALLQVLDLHSTHLAAQAGRSETNPFILALAANVGFMPAVAAFKAGSIAVIGAYYLVIRTFKRTFWPAVSLIPVCAAYVTVVFNNYL